TGHWPAGIGVARLTGEHGGGGPADPATQGMPRVRPCAGTRESGVSVPTNPATRSRPMRTPLLLLLACGTAACGADMTARNSLTAAVDTVNGVERLSYPADAAGPLAWRFDTLAMIGGAMVDDENYQFQGVSRARLAGNAQG